MNPFVRWFITVLIAFIVATIISIGIQNVQREINRDQQYDVALKKIENQNKKNQNEFQEDTEVPNQTVTQQKQDLKKEKIYSTTHNSIPIKINPLQEFSGKKSEEILALRRKAVKNSTLFSGLADYEPGRDTFLLTDGLQWIGAHEISCNGTTSNVGRGPSRESLDVLNPEMLYSIIINTYAFSKYNYACSENDYQIPYKLTYDRETNTINAFINHTDLKTKLGRFDKIYIKDFNAHDLGYNWAFSNSSVNVRYANQYNMGTNLVKTNGYIHKGYSCGLPEGCNNYSPRQEAYYFYLTALPAMVNIKLWKEHPSSTNNRADINFRFIFE